MEYDRENESGQEAEVSTRVVLRIISPLDYKVEALTSDFRPFLAAEWNRAISTSIGGIRLIDFTGMFRISRLPKDLYIKILKSTKFRDIGESEIAPSELEDWRMIIVRRGIEDAQPFRDWIFAICPYWCAFHFCDHGISRIILS